MDVLAPLLADREAPELAQPGQGPLYHPSVTTEPGRGLHPPAGAPGRDVAGAQGAAAARDVVGHVGVESDGSPSPLPRRAPARRERGAPAVDHHVALGARLGPVRRVGAGRAAPLLAAGRQSWVLPLTGGGVTIRRDVAESDVREILAKVLSPGS